jgi:hypothetical protein
VHALGTERIDDLGLGKTISCESGWSCEGVESFGEERGQCLKLTGGGPSLMTSSLTG